MSALNDFTLAGVALTNIYLKNGGMFETKCIIVRVPNGRNNGKAASFDFEIQLNGYAKIDERKEYQGKPVIVRGLVRGNKTSKGYYVVNLVASDIRIFPEDAAAQPEQRKSGDGGQGDGAYGDVVSDEMPF